MAWKMASAFVVAGENQEPNGIFAFAVAAAGVEGLFRQLERNSAGEFLAMAEPMPLTQQQCDPEFVLMLPEPNAQIDPEVMAAMKQLFSLGGEMEARP